ncbi:MAG: hypothetical protein E7106_08090 [Prevotella sp.]|nr:hypothetical protein [Prevotella sp.]MBP3787928.1 hypothetical protein [Prevotella sp.]
MAKLKQTKTELKEKASKDARKEAKRLQKEGWQAFPGGLPMDKQVDRVYMYLESFDDDLNPQYVDGSGTATGESYAAAQAQATELARIELASKIGSEATGIIDNMLGNKMLANDQAASVTTYLSENKTIFSQKLGRVQTPLQLRRELKNKNKEVTVRMIAKRADILEIAKQAIRDQLEKDGKQLSDELKAYFGN